MGGGEIGQERTATAGMRMMTITRTATVEKEKVIISLHPRGRRVGQDLDTPRRIRRGRVKVKEKAG